MNDCMKGNEDIDEDDTPKMHQLLKKNISTNSCLHVPSTSDTQSLPRNIAHIRTHNRQHRTRRLSRRSRPAQRNILESILTILPSSFLLLRNAQRNLHAIWRGNKRTLLLRSSQTSGNMAECNGVGSHAERRTPLFGDGFGQASHAGFGEGVVCLACVAVQTRGGGDVDDVPGLAVFDAEVGRCGADELEGLRVVEGQDGVPLFVGCLEEGVGL